MNVTPPPATQSYDDLLALRRRLHDAVILVVDFEANSCLPEARDDPSQSVTQVGMASLDMRELGKSTTEATPEEIAAKIRGTNHLVDHPRWLLSESTVRSMCNSVFCLSEVSDTPDQALERAKSRIQDLKTVNYHRKNIEASASGPSQRPNKVTKRKHRRQENSLGSPLHGLTAAGDWTPERDVYVRFWGSSLEERIFTSSQHNPFTEGGYTLWDLQRWLPIKRRHWEKDQCKCSEFIVGVGLKEMVEYLHNAANDAWVVLMGFIQVLRLNDEMALMEFMHGQGEFEEVDLSWVDESIYDENQMMMY